MNDLPRRRRPGRSATALQLGRRLRLEDDAAGAVCVAEVAEIRADALVVRLLDPAPPGAFRAGTTVDLTVTSPDGLYRSTTTVEAAELEGVADDGVLDLRPPAGFEVVQRRAQPRGRRRVPGVDPAGVARAAPRPRDRPGRGPEPGRHAPRQPGALRRGPRARAGAARHARARRAPGPGGGEPPRDDGTRTLHVAFSRFGDETLDVLQELCPAGAPPPAEPGGPRPPRRRRGSRR